MALHVDHNSLSDGWVGVWVGEGGTKDTQTNNAINCDRADLVWPWTQLNNNLGIVFLPLILFIKK